MVSNLKFRKDYSNNWIVKCSSLIFIMKKSFYLLGECLTELAETSDTNAVLILQPAVEVFFLVHGSDKDELQDKNKKSDASDSAPAASLDLPPFSPGPLSPGGLQSPSRQSSISSISPDLPADTQKFLKFAGKYLFEVTISVFFPGSFIYIYIFISIICIHIHMYSSAISAFDPLLLFFIDV